MSTIPVLVHPHQHHRCQDALDILELGLLLALELLGTNFIGKLFTKPVKFALKWRETAESLKEKITSIRVSLSDTLMPTLLEMPDPETSIQLKLDELVWDVAQLVHELEEVEGWGATARFVRVRQMKKKVKKAKSTAQDFQTRLHTIQHEVEVQLQLRLLARQAEMQEELAVLKDIACNVSH